MARMAMTLSKVSRSVVGPSISTVAAVSHGSWEGDGYSGSSFDRTQLDHCGTVDADRAARWPSEAQHQLQLQQNSASFAGRTDPRRWWSLAELRK